MEQEWKIYLLPKKKMSVETLHPFLAGPPETTVEVIEVDQGEK
jgi:hypothetical protein